MQLVFFKKPIEDLIKSKRVYVRASTKGSRRRKAYYRTDPRNAKPESIGRRRVSETYEIEVPSSGAYSMNEVKEAIGGSGKDYQVSERGGNIVISSPSNKTISNVREAFITKFNHQPEIKTIQKEKKAKGLSKEEKISQPGAVAEYSGIKFRREGPGKFVPIRGQKVKKKTMEKVKKELKRDPEAKILAQEKSIKDTHRNLLNYFRGRENNTIVETTPAPKVSEITPQDIMKIRMDPTGQEINKFIFDNDDFARKMAWKLYDEKISEKIGVDDLAQMARLGMFQAVQKFDVKRKFDTSGAFVNYMKKAMLNNMVYMKNLYLKRSLEGLKNPLALDATFAGGGEDEAHEREMYESVPSQYQGPRSLEFVEFKSTIAAMKRQIKNTKAKKILELLASNYGETTDIAKKLKLRPRTVYKLISRHIKPIAKKFLMKSHNKYLINFLKSLDTIEAEEPMKLVFFLKSKRVYVPAAGGRKAYYRQDPRNKKAEEQTEKKTPTRQDAAWEIYDAAKKGGGSKKIDKLLKEKNKEWGFDEGDLKDVRTRAHEYFAEEGEPGVVEHTTGKKTPAESDDTAVEDSDAADWDKAHETFKKLGKEEKGILNTLASVSTVDDDGVFAQYNKKEVIKKFGSEDKWKQWFNSSVKPLGKKVGGEKIFDKLIGISSESGKGE